jgi:hypothetical protein
MRKHGWQLPLDSHQVLHGMCIHAYHYLQFTSGDSPQVAALVVYAVVVAGCYALFIPFVTGRQAQVACAVLYTVAVCVVVLLGIVTW